MSATTGVVNSRAVSTSGSALSCASVNGKLCRVVQTFLKMSEESTLDLFDTELFITEIEQLSAIL